MHPEKVIFQTPLPNSHALNFPSLFLGLLLFYLQLLCVFLNDFGNRLQLWLFYITILKFCKDKNFFDHNNTLFETLKSPSFSQRTSGSPFSLLTIALSLSTYRSSTCMYVHIGILMYGEDS